MRGQENAHNFTVFNQTCTLIKRRFTSRKKDKAEVTMKKLRSIFMRSTCCSDTLAVFLGILAM